MTRHSACTIAAAGLLPAVFVGCAGGDASHESPAATSTATRAAPTALDRLESVMTGHFTSAQQAAEDEAYFDVTLHMVPIWPEHSTDTVRWLYVEQAITAAADRPYRQRVYRLSDEGLALVSAVYELSGEAQQYAGAWRDASLLAGVGPDDLIEREGCAITLIEGVDGSYVGSTNEDDCASTLRGATYATSRVTIREGTVESWDQGFDAAGEQVWGAVKGPYFFRRID